MVVGITGSIACGKSLVSSYLINLHYPVIDCDKITHNILFIDEVKEKIVNEFGMQILNDDNTINRKALGKIVFSNENKLKLLEQIEFPYILSEIKKEINRYNGIVFLDAPLLIEYQLQYLVDKIIVIKCDKEIQINRLINRDNISREYALKKINSVLSSEEKEKYANYVIDNSSTIENTYNQINNILKTLEELQ